MQYSELKLYNPGVITTRIPVRVFAELTQDLQKCVDNNPPKYNDGLAGHLEAEFGYTIKDSFKECVDHMCNEYKNRFDFYVGHEHVVDSNSWVNFQKKHEYNPLHYHYDDLSWVLWVSIPYDLEDELSVPSIKEANSKCGSKFQFVYNKLDSGIYTHEINIDKTYEGVLMMFPSYLKHQVYSFQTSDEHRISISGNIRIKHK